MSKTTKEERALWRKCGARVLHGRKPCDVILALLDDLEAAEARVAELEAENARLRAALEWATKQLGRAPTRSARASSSSRSESSSRISLR